MFPVPSHRSSPNLTFSPFPMRHTFQFPTRGKACTCDFYTIDPLGDFIGSHNHSDIDIVGKYLEFITLMWHPQNKEIGQNNLESKIAGNLFPFLVNSEIGKFLPFMEILNFKFYDCNKWFDCWAEIWFVSTSYLTMTLVWKRKNIIFLYWLQEDKWSSHVEFSWQWLHEWGTHWNKLWADCYKWKNSDLANGSPWKSRI